MWITLCPMLSARHADRSAKSVYLSVSKPAVPKPEARPEVVPVGWRVAGMIGFPLLAALTSQTHLWVWLAIPIEPFGVPMTLQSLWVVLSALCIGPRFGTLAFLGYLLVGVLGVPLFAEGNYGVATLLGQTGGYLVGFVLCQPVVAWVVRRRDGTVRGWGALIVATLACHAVIFAIGVPWLWVVHQIDGLGTTVMQAIDGGFVMFLPGMLVKCALAVLIGLALVPYAARKIW